jgi:NADPH:quinone reductase-like Zn-dependent oxidoreductase
LQITRKPSDDKPFVPGIDVAGIVDAVGRGVDALYVGQEVFGVCNAVRGQGPWAEYCIAEKRYIAEKPNTWVFAEAAACASSGAVVASMLRSAKNITGKKCLVIGASGGIGTLCVQALKNEKARVWGVCSQKNMQTVLQLGAERVLDYTKSPISEQIRKMEEHVDIVFDLVGGKSIEKEAMSVLKNKGTFITIVGPSQYVGKENIGVTGVLSSFAYIGWRMFLTKMGSGPNYVFTGAGRPDFTLINQVLANPGSKPVINAIKSLTLADMVPSMGQIRSCRTVGKIVIKVR